MVLPMLCWPLDLNNHMLIVIPVGPRDAENLSLLIQAIVALGHPEAQIVVVCVPSVSRETQDITVPFAKKGLHISGKITDDDFDQPWPVGPDRMWLWTVRYLDSIGNTQPWLWLEPDACPVQKGWDVKLASAYAEAGKPFFGFTRPINWRSPDGTVTKKEGDNMMLGVAIYPPGMTRDQDVVPLLNDLAHPDAKAHPLEPFDMYLRHHMHRKGVHSTNLIYDRWRTCGYQRDDFERLECKPVEGEPTAEGGVIPAEALLVHGCKDGSLHRLVIEENKLPHIVTLGKGVQVLKEKWTVETEERLIPNISVTKENPFDLRVEAVKEQAKKTLVEHATKVLKDQTFPSPPSEVLQQCVLDVIKAMPAPRLRGVMEQTGLDKAQVKTILPLIGYESNGPGWISKSKKKKVKP